jgi:MFS transporter, DHA1 family, inner membrane transport protein
LSAARWALLLGNFAIACGVMVTSGALNDIVRSLQVSVSVAGQLTAAGAVVVGFGAPLLAAAVAGWDRRRLLTAALVWFGLGHLACALAPDFAWLLPLRVGSMLGAAVFTPQAAAAISVMAPPAERGRAITFVFLGWSLASVLGMPLHSFVSDTAGWRWAFALVAAMSLLTAAGVWRSLPDGVRPAALSLTQWRRVLTHPMLMGMVAVTAASAAGQFTLFAYMAPYYRDVLQASPAQISALFLAFGAFGLIGNMALARWVDRIGAGPAATLGFASIAVSLLLWPLATTPLQMALMVLPWGLGCFSSNSAQQARLGHAAPMLAPALMALNSSAMYLGQAIGASSGGLLIAQSGLSNLHAWAAAWMLAAMGFSAWLGVRMKAAAHA